MSEQVALPEGSVTMLFTDIQGSTRLLDRLGDRYGDLLGEHHRVLRAAIAGSDGREVGTAGDSFFAVFSSPSGALECARSAQRELAAIEWPGEEPLLVRMGVHTGIPTVRDGQFVGIDVHRAARVMAVAHGGQVLLTDDTRRAVAEPLQLRDLGHHRLKDLREPEHLFQLVAPGLLDGFPSLRSLNRSNLPTPAQPLVGRREEQAMALGMLAHRNVRLVTLLGPGGSGKTRLAIEVAGEAVRRYRDGVWIVALAPIPDPALMISELARVLEVDPAPGESLDQTLTKALSERELLLVLDNFEHLIGAAGAVADLLAAAPGVDVLTTSREALRIRGEHRMEVAPLPLPDATELFLQRALAVRPELMVDEENRAAIQRICARLDGLPLALELAAARIAVFAPSALEARLPGRLALPEGPADLPERQRTLRATMDWSYQLLEAADRTALQRLSPFIGGVRIESAESIFEGSGRDPVDGLTSLREKSLLNRREDADGEPRFWMLETIRAFAAERAVADGTADASASRHAEYFLALTDEAGPHLLGRDQRRWLDRLEAEHPNLRAALDHLTRYAPERALRMAGVLFWLWDIRGYLPEARRRLTDVLAAAARDVPGRAPALFGAGRMALILGDAVSAKPLLLEAVSVARDEGDARVAANALSNLGWAVQSLGEHANASACHEKALAIARESNDPWALGVVLNNRAEMVRKRGDLERARGLLHEALMARRRGGEPRGIALTACNAAAVALDCGDLKEADALITEALQLARAIDFRPMIGTALALGTMLELYRGDIDRAEAQLAEAINLTRSTSDLEMATLVLSGAATLAARRGQSLRAATLWAAADRAVDHLNMGEVSGAVALRATWLAEAQAATADRSSWNSAWAVGVGLSLDDALAFAADRQRERWPVR